VRYQKRFTAQIYTDLFEKYHPDLVVAASPGFRQDRYLLREAVAHEIRTAAAIISWDSSSSYGLPGAPVDWITCWSEVQKQELVGGADWNPERVNVGGMPPYDHYIRNTWQMPRAEYFRLHGLDPQRKLLSYASSFVSWSPNYQNVEALAVAARDIRRFARNLIGQGVAARQLTQLISHLNDVLTEHLVQLMAQQEGVDLQKACWLAFGSEGRSEQTISTDQDNGLVFVSDNPAHDREKWLKFARRVNEALDQCGYPLCKGNVMASNPELCLSVEEWRAKMGGWLQNWEPKALLDATIYFDFRPLYGDATLATGLHQWVLERTRAYPNFLRQMAQNAMQAKPALGTLRDLPPRMFPTRRTASI